MIQFNIQCLPQTSPVIDSRPSINWDFDNSDKLDRFYNCLDASLQSFPTNSDNPQCARYQCTEPGHATCIERSYGELNAKIIECGKIFLGLPRIKVKLFLVGIKLVGPDEIRAEVYKHGSPILFRVVACLFN